MRMIRRRGCVLKSRRDSEQSQVSFVSKGRGLGLMDLVTFGSAGVFNPEARSGTDSFSRPNNKKNKNKAP